jgi:hypothetical protein
MRMPVVRLITLSVALVALASCSYVYKLRAVAVGGRLAFVVDPSSHRRPKCVRSVSVVIDDDGPRATPAPGDDKALVLNGGVYWEQTVAVDECPNPFPVVYGAALKGVPFDYGDGRTSSVAAKPLRPGFVYEVDTSSRGSGYGTGWFRIRMDGRIENLPSDPTPRHLMDDASGKNAG